MNGQDFMDDVQGQNEDTTTGMMSNNNNNNNNGYVNYEDEDMLLNGDGEDLNYDNDQMQ
jgi:hypothetical protein